MLRTKKVNIAALAVNENLLSGDPLLELLPTDGQLAIGVTASSAAGPVTGDLEIDFMCGGEWEATGWMPRHTGTVPTTPVIPDDFPLSCDGLANDRVVIKARNKHATVAQDLIITFIFSEA